MALNGRLLALAVCAFSAGCVSTPYELETGGAGRISIAQLEAERPDFFGESFPPYGSEESRQLWRMESDAYVRLEFALAPDPQPESRKARDSGVIENAWIAACADDDDNVVLPGRVFRAPGTEPAAHGGEGRFIAYFPLFRERIPQILSEAEAEGGLCVRYGLGYWPTKRLQSNLAALDDVADLLLDDDAP